MKKEFSPIFYHRVCGLLKAPVKFLFKPTIIGSENIPVNETFILAGNHKSILDIPLLAVNVERPIHFMAKKELFKYDFIETLLTKGGAFPIDRDGSDFRAVMTAIKLLRNNNIVCIFPEGTRNKDNEDMPFKPIADLAIRAKAPIVPFGISGSYRLRHGITLHFGKAINIDTLKELEETADNYIKSTVKYLIKKG
jgi:1-acyl-sn-glycerol-3-phosphate acyltransferase